MRAVEGGMLVLYQKRATRSMSSSMWTIMACSVFSISHFSRRPVSGQGDGREKTEAGDQQETHRWGYTGGGANVEKLVPEDSGLD
jgi:hypothetical protein